MKKLILATAAAAFVLGTGFANAEDTKANAPTQKTPTQQQMDTNASGGSKMAPAGTTGAGMKAGAGMNSKSGESKLPGKPGETVKDGTNSK